MTAKKSAWAKVLRVLALLTALALIYYWFWHLPAQQPPAALQVQFTP
ncbi:MAG: hypothetical protein NZ556_05650 [Fimbriimonadales bacterium]|nr:hypothetical protein [Fimbriimonadales bacterium]